MRRFIAPLLIAFASGGAAQTVHRCQIDGRTVYQQSPCSGLPPPAGSTPSPSRQTPQRPPIGDPTYEAQRDEERRRALNEWRQEAGRELERKYQAQKAKCPSGIDQPPTPGVSQQWVIDCSSWGEPRRRTTLTTALGTSHQWHYSLGTLYFGENGRLRTIITTK